MLEVLYRYKKAQSKALADMIKDLEMRLSRCTPNAITNVFIRQREMGHRKEGGCVNRGSDWNGVATSQGMLATNQSWKNLWREHGTATTLISAS